MAENHPRNAPTPAFSQFSAELSDSLQRVAETYLEEFDEHEAFDYLTAELFATTKQGQFVFTDGPNDGGIDFFVKNGPSYTICQCKCSELDSLLKSPTPVTFDDKALDEITSAARMLQDPVGKYKISNKIRMLRTDYQRDQQEDEEARLLTAILSISGELTPSAKTKFLSEQSNLKKQGVNLRLLTWRELYHAMHFQELDIESVKFEVTCNDVKKELLRFQDYCYILAHAHDFYDAFREHEWNLFDQNVRLQITNSAINGKIAATLSKEKSRKRFHHLNNGILITCSSYKVDEREQVVRLTGAQIVNGCQTVRAICEAYEALEPNEQDNFRKTARVQVKIIKNVDTELIDQLAITTNDQNPMTPRNLKSNTSEQKGIQNAFRNIRPVPWFYERKDGEFKSYLSTHTSVRWFRKSDYSTSKSRFRRLENSELCRIWYSFTGFSDRSVRGGIDFFQDDDIYAQIFKHTPNEKFRGEFASNPHFSPTDDWFEIGTPSPHVYLLAYVISKYINSRTLSSHKNKEDAIERGVKEGALKRDGQSRLVSADDEVSRFLADDGEYRLNIMLSNMKDVMIELYALVLSSRYGNIDAQLATRVLTSPEMAEFVTSACAPELAPAAEQNGEKIIGPTYEFLRYCTKQYFYANQAEIQAAARIKSYLWHRRVVAKMRENVIKLSAKIIDYDEVWKPRGKKFFDSLS
jgi:hypothetical protein